MSWQEFQKEMKGRGYSDAYKSLIYDTFKNAVVNPKKSPEENQGKFETFRDAMRAFSEQPQTMDIKTENELIYYAILDLTRQRRIKFKELRLTTDESLREQIKQQIADLSSKIDRLRRKIREIEIVYPVGSWQQFEYEMSPFYTKRFSAKQLSQLYNQTKDDVISGKYPNFTQAVMAIRFPRYSPRSYLPRDAIPPVLDMPRQLVKVEPAMDVMPRQEILPQLDMPRRPIKVEPGEDKVEVLPFIQPEIKEELNEDDDVFLPEPALPEPRVRRVRERPTFIPTKPPVILSQPTIRPIVKKESVAPEFVSKADELLKEVGDILAKGKLLGDQVREERLRYEKEREEKDFVLTQRLERDRTIAEKGKLLRSLLETKKKLLIERRIGEIGDIDKQLAQTRLDIATLQKMQF